MFSLVGAASVFGGIVLGPLSDRIGRRVTMAGAFALFAVSTVAILPGRQPLQGGPPRRATIRSARTAKE